MTTARSADAPNDATLKLKKFSEFVEAEHVDLRN